MTEGGEPRFNSIVELLASTNPATLDKLRSTYPNLAASLQPVMPMGGSADATDKRQLYCDLCREGISAAELEVAKLLRTLPSRLGRAKRLRLASAIISSIASAGVLTAVFADAPRSARIAAVIAFLATLCTLLAQYLETPIGGGRLSIADQLRDAVALQRQLQDAKLKMLDADTDAPLGRRRSITCRDIIPTINDIAAKIRTIELFAGTA